MASLIIPPFENFQDVDGNPLESGYVYIGQAGLNPEASPITVYWDEGLTIPAAQPLRTIGGFLSNSGTPANIFCFEDTYSVSVRNKNGSLVYSSLSSGSSLRTLYVADYAELRLLNTGPLPDGLPLEVTNSGIGGTGVLRNVSSHGLTDNGGTIIVINADWYWERQYSGSVNVKWFGATGDGVTDDTTAIQAALDLGGSTYIPRGDYVVSSTLTYYVEQEVHGDGDVTDIKSAVNGANIFQNSGQIYNFNFRNFRVTGSGNETGGFRCTTTFEGFTLSDLTFSGVGGKCFWFTDCFVGTLRNVWAQGSFAQEYGLYLEGCTNMGLYGCRFRQSLQNGAGVGITRGPSGTTYAINFDSCLVEANLGAGVKMQSCVDVIFKTCYFERNNGYVTTDSAWRTSHIEITDVDGQTPNECSGVVVDGGYYNGLDVHHLVKSDIEVSGLELRLPEVQRWAEVSYQNSRYNLDLILSDSSALTDGIPPSQIRVGIQEVTFKAGDATAIGQVYGVTAYDADDVEYVASFTSATGAETGVSIASSLVASLAGMARVTVTDNLDGTFTLTKNGVGAFNFTGVDRLAYVVDDSSQRLTATNYTTSSQEDVQLVYMNSGGTQAEGVIPATITSTRIMQSGSLKICTYEIDSIDVSGLIAGALSGRLVALIPRVGRFSVGFFTAPVEHGGTPVSGVLSFYLRSGRTSTVFFLQKEPLVAGGTRVGRVSDLDGVTSLGGSFSYF